jgi:hypothetical protein
VLIRVAVLGLALVAMLSSPGAALASKEFPGTVLRLSLSPDDPFFIDGEGLSVLLSVHAASAISGDFGIGVALPPELSASACPSAGDRLLIFLDLGAGGGQQCLSTWLASPASRITQLPGVALPASTSLSAELPPLLVTPSLPRGVLVVFAYILDSSSHAIIDGTTTTLDLE